MWQDRDGTAAELLLVEARLWPLRVDATLRLPSSECVAAVLATLDGCRDWPALVKEGCFSVMNASNHPYETASRLRELLGDAGGVTTFLELARHWECERYRTEIPAFCVLAVAELCGGYPSNERSPANIRRAVAEGANDLVGRMLSGPALKAHWLAKATVSLWWHLCCPSEGTITVRKHFVAAMDVARIHADHPQVVQLTTWVVVFLVAHCDDLSFLVPHIATMALFLERQTDTSDGAPTIDIVRNIIASLPVLIVRSNDRGVTRAIAARVGVAVVAAARYPDEPIVATTILSLLLALSEADGGMECVMAHASVVASTLARLARVPNVAQIGMHCLWNLAAVDAHHAGLVPFAGAVMTAMKAQGADRAVVRHGIKFFSGVSMVAQARPTLLAHVGPVMALLKCHVDSSNEDVAISGLGFLLNECSVPAFAPRLVAHVDVVLMALKRHAGSATVALAAMAICNYLAAARDEFLAAARATPGAGVLLSNAVKCCRLITPDGFTHDELTALLPEL